MVDIRKKSKHPLWALAIHEASHAVVAHVLGFDVEWVKITDSSGIVYYGDGKLTGIDLCEGRIIAALAGVVGNSLLSYPPFDFNLSHDRGVTRMFIDQIEPIDEKIRLGIMCRLMDKAIAIVKDLHKIIKRLAHIIIAWRGVVNPFDAPNLRHGMSPKAAELFDKPIEQIIHLPTSGILS